MKSRGSGNRTINTRNPARGIHIRHPPGLLFWLVEDKAPWWPRGWLQLAPCPPAWAGIARQRAGPRTERELEIRSHNPRQTPVSCLFGGWSCEKTHTRAALSNATASNSEWEQASCAAHAPAPRRLTSTTNTIAKSPRAAAVSWQSSEHVLSRSEELARGAAGMSTRPLRSVGAGTGGRALHVLQRE